MKRHLFFITLIVSLFSSFFGCAQATQTFDLKRLLEQNKLSTYKPGDILALDNNEKDGVSCSNGIFWIRDLNFSYGTIELDMKGVDVPQQSFVGIAFHAIDTVTYESVYFRPFNFRTTDSVRINHAVQYVSYPDYPWERLRNEQPLVYEKPIVPSIDPAGWFHVRIVLKDNWVTVYLNYSPDSALKVKNLSKRKDGLIGLWSYGQREEFANLVIKKDP